MKTYHRSSSQSTDTNKNMFGYSLFDEIKSQYSSSNKENKNFYGGYDRFNMEEPSTIIRNKIAFFKKAGVLLKNYDF
jgi:hypothetical protein